MHLTVQKISVIKNKVKEVFNKTQLKTDIPEIIAVSKTFPQSSVLPLLEIGHLHFGENKIQEAASKWVELLVKYPNTQLHFLGKLQTNKVKKAVQLFNYIHSLDSEKLAKTLFEKQKEQNKNLKFFIEVNMAGEKQKSGISENELNDFYDYCTREINLNVIGLMCLPPFSEDSEKYFKKLKIIADNLNVKNLSMGMTADYDKAVIHGSNFLRIGTAIFGERKN
tara:strand:- start:324 stop:992 length:669 start_codon:yes stop_codon:yes gene_type:complete